MVEQRALAQDFASGLGRLVDIGRRGGVDSLVLRAPATLTWLTGGRVNVPNTLDTACFDVVVDDIGASPTATVVTNAVEAPRLAATELAGLPVKLEVVPWTHDRSARLPTGAAVGTDVPAAGRKDLSGEITVARRSLTTHQVNRLRALCVDAAAAMTAVAGSVEPEMTEYAAAGQISAELLQRGMEPVCLFVAGGDRMGEHRHSLPTTGLIGRRASLVCCARRHGLIASVTRIVCFGPPPDRGRYLALLEVERAFLDATAPGVELGAVIRAGITAYAINGFADDEWRRHHQGGLSGWQPREFPAGPGSAVPMGENAVVAWNPSGDTYKVEDTCLVTRAGAEPLVTDADWPSVSVGGRLRPDLMIR